MSKKKNDFIKEKDNKLINYPHPISADAIINPLEELTPEEKAKRHKKTLRDIKKKFKELDDNYEHYYQEAKKKAEEITAQQLLKENE